MEARVIQRSVIVDVRPRLLSDTLVRALHDVDPAAAIILDPVPGEARQFDVAVVIGPLPAGVHADVVIQLPAEGGSQTGSVTTARGTEPARVGDLSTLLETLEYYLLRG